MPIVQITVCHLGMQGEYDDAWHVYEVKIYHQGGEVKVVVEDHRGLEGFLKGLKTYARLSGHPEPPEPEHI